MEKKCPGCGADEFVDYGDEYACTHCGNSYFKTEESDFSKKEQEFLAENKFRKKNQISYIRSTKTVDFVIYRMDIGNWKFCFDVFEKGQILKTKTTTVCEELKDCVSAFKKKYQNPA